MCERGKFRSTERRDACEETDDEVVLVNDRRGRVIGFERLSFVTGIVQPETVILSAAKNLFCIYGRDPSLRSG